ncbi:MAG: hypothetical protein QXT77_05935 [Candidatus Methanomethylicaceae archaeon]
MSIKQFGKEWRSNNLIMFVHEVLEKRIKEDDITKLSAFFTGLSAYCEPINLFLKGESGIGKSYNTTEALRHFPAGDVWFLGNMSPKVLIHLYGINLTKDGRRVEELEYPERPKKKDYVGMEKEYAKAYEEWKRLKNEYAEAIKDSYTLVDMSRKILVFLETPDPDTFRILLPILSHDREEIQYRFTDKTPKGRLKSTLVIIKGWPSTVFLTTDKSFMEELATRSFTASPESTETKINAANMLTNEKVALPWSFEEDDLDKSLRMLILTLKSLDYAGVIVPFTTLHELFPKKIVRDMRDFQHFCQFTKTVAFLNALQRPWIEVSVNTDPISGKKEVKKYLIAIAEDVWNAIQLYSFLFETTRTGTEDRILKFYNEVVKTREIWTTRELVDEYNKISSRKVSKDWVEKALKRLSVLGYADSEPDPNDKRRLIWRPIITNNEITEIRRKFESREYFEEVLRRGAENWVKKIADKVPFMYKRDESNNIIKIEGESILAEIMKMEKIFSYNTGQDASAILKNQKFTENDKNGEKKSDEYIYRRISANSGGDDKSTELEKSVEQESCVNCGEYDPDQSLCLYYNQQLPPHHKACKEFTRVKFICNTCGCGPWKDCKFAQEHLSMFESHTIKRIK